MAEIGISEFTFGYAFLYERTQANWGDLKAAPVLPSLQREEKEGWDARLPLNGTDFYYQFKLSEYLKRSNATHALLSSLAAVGRTLVASSSGVLAEALGWVPFFLLTTVATVPALLLLVWVERRDATASNRQSPLPAFTKG